jgi:MraZ protein
MWRSGAGWTEQAMFFVGTFELTIDAKSRLSVPHAIRSKMNCDTDGRSFYVVPGQRRGTLAIYPERYFEKIRAEVPPPEQLSEDGHEWRQFEYSQSALLDPDGQGRILIPERLLKRAGIGREVTLIGVQDRMELWDRAAFDAFQDDKWPTYPEHRTKAMLELRELRKPNTAADAPA